MPSFKSPWPPAALRPGILGGHAARDNDAQAGRCPPAGLMIGKLSAAFARRCMRSSTATWRTCGHARHHDIFAGVLHIGLAARVSSAAPPSPPGCAHGRCGWSGAASTGVSNCSDSSKAQLGKVQALLAESERLQHGQSWQRDGMVAGILLVLGGVHAGVVGHDR